MDEINREIGLAGLAMGDAESGNGSAEVQVVGGEKV